MNENGSSGDFIEWQNHLGVPPGARVEFVLNGPPPGTTGLLVTRTVDTGPGGENDPNRAIPIISASDDAPELHSRLDASPERLPPPSLPWLGNVAPCVCGGYIFRRSCPIRRTQTVQLNFTSPWMDRPPRPSIGIRACRTSSQSRARWKIGSSRTGPPNCTLFTFINFISCCWIYLDVRLMNLSPRHD